jgi:Holliday junction DNA helicase RuvA
MIEWLSGIIRSKNSPHLVVDVRGVGYGVDVPQSTFERLPDAGQPVELHTYSYIREDQMTLYGFLTAEEREIFEVFIGTSGIGPKTSLGILSALSIAEFAEAVLNNNLAVLTRIPGIGRKTAERLVLELRDKMKDYAIERDALGAAVKHTPQVDDAIAALVSLQVKPPVAAAAVARAVRALGETASAEALIREALKHR